MHFDPPYIMSVDNSSTGGMDFSALLVSNPDLWMVQWTDGKGEIERQTADGKNLNGLRESFIDVIPYAPLFQQFLTLMQAKALLLPQAKKVQIELIAEIFEGKRQAPFYYPVAAGNYTWDATDETLYASTAAGLQNAIAKINEVAQQLNSFIPGLIASINLIVAAANTLRDQANVQIVNNANALRGEVNGSVVGPTNTAIEVSQTVITYINETLLGMTLAMPVQPLIRSMANCNT